MTLDNTALSSRLEVIDSLKFSEIEYNECRLEFTIPSDADSFSFHIFFSPNQIKAAGSYKGHIFLLIGGPNSVVIPRNGLPFLYREKFTITLNDIEKGYCAFIAPIPIKEFRDNGVSGNWDATLYFERFTGPDFKAEELEVRICQRILPGSPTVKYDKFKLPVNLFYIGNRWSKYYGNMQQEVFNYLSKSIYEPIGIELIFDWRNIDIYPNNITSDLWRQETMDLISNTARKEAVNVYLVEKMEIEAEGGLGFSMLPGPQGFISPYNGVFIRMKNPDGYLAPPTPEELARTIGHEIGHYLGLTHNSSCLDEPCSDDECKKALRNEAKTDEEKKRIKKFQSNLMFTARPDNRLNKEQEYILRKAPLITAFSRKTPIWKLRVKVKTGDKFYDWWLLDDAGTYHTIVFIIGGPGNSATQRLNTSRDDFEPNKDRWFTIDPSGLNVEDIKSFLIGKSPDNLFNTYNVEDKWLLDGLIIEINKKEIFKEQNINQWLHINSDGPASWGKNIPPDNLKPLLP